MVDVFIGVWMQLVWFKCVKSEGFPNALTRPTVLITDNEIKHENNFSYLY